MGRSEEDAKERNNSKIEKKGRSEEDTKRR
jgi:hypothetical protein